MSQFLQRVLILFRDDLRTPTASVQVFFFPGAFSGLDSYHNTCDTRNGLGHKLLQYAVMAATVDQKLLRATKFPPEFNTKVDMQKVNLQVMKK